MGHVQSGAYENWIMCTKDIRGQVAIDNPRSTLHNEIAARQSPELIVIETCIDKMVRSPFCMKNPENPKTKTKTKH